MGKTSAFAGSTSTRLILTFEAIRFLENVMVLSIGIADSKTEVKWSQLLETPILILTTDLKVLLPIDEGVPILRLEILATVPKLNVRYCCQPMPSLSAGDQAKRTTVMVLARINANPSILGANFVGFLLL